MFRHISLPYSCLPSLLSPGPSHPHQHPPPEAAPPPTRDRAPQRNAAASIQTAARGSAQAGTPPLLRTSGCAPSRSPRPSESHSQRGWCGYSNIRTRPAESPPALRDPLYHTTRGATAGEKKQENLSSQMMVPQRVTFRALAGFPIHPQHVCGPHLSSDASLSPALRFELYEVDSKRRIIKIGADRFWKTIP